MLNAGCRKPVSGTPRYLDDDGPDAGSRESRHPAIRSTARRASPSGVVPATKQISRFGSHRRAVGEGPVVFRHRVERDFCAIRLSGREAVAHGKPNELIAYSQQGDRQYAEAETELRQCRDSYENIPKTESKSILPSRSQAAFRATVCGKSDVASSSVLLFTCSRLGMI